jgi:hypothetical protein
MCFFALGRETAQIVYTTPFAPYCVAYFAHDLAEVAFGICSHDFKN